MVLHKFFLASHLYYNNGMNPLFNTGMFGLSSGCPTCSRSDKCHSAPCKRDKCPKDECGCPEPFIELDEVPGKSAVYRVNDNGKTAIWDLRDGIKKAQTDTTLVSDVVNRLLRYTAERHTDTITAKDLGAILHLNDLGDVSTKGADDGAMMVFKKSDTCPDGCYGTNNVWEPFNALDEQTSAVAYGYGFDANGIPATIQQPANPNQYYNFGWNGKDKLSYAQPAEETAPILDSQGYAYQIYINPATKQPYYVKVKP